MPAERLLIPAFKGLNLSDHPTVIDDGELTACINFYPERGRLVRRAGQRVLSLGGAHVEDITGVMRVNRPDKGGTVAALVGTLTKISRFRQSTLTFNDLTDTSALLSSSSALWQFFQYRGFNYALRNGGGGSPLIRIVGSTSFLRAGVAAPGTTPTLTADATGGTLVAGDYRGVVTFVTNDGQESAPSPVGTVTLGVTGRIDWSAIPTSANAQVNRRKLYRSLVGQVGEYFLVTTINDNTTTTFADDSVEPQDLGALANFDTGVPPDAAAAKGAIWKDRLFLSDGQTVYYSNVGRVAEFAASSTFIPSQVSSSDSSVFVKALIPAGERLLILCDRGVLYLQGTSPSTWELKVLSDVVGCYAPFSAASGDGLAFWLGINDFYMSDGQSIRSIGRGKVRPLIHNIEKETAGIDQKPFGFVYERKHWYLISVPTIDVATNKLIIGYNYEDDAWFTFNTNNGTDDVPSVFVVDYDSDPEWSTTDEPVGSILAGGTSNHLLRFHVDDEGAGTPVVADEVGQSGGVPTTVDVVARFMTKAFQPNGPRRYGVRRVAINMHSALELGATTGTLAIYNELYVPFAGTTALAEVAVAKSRASLSLVDAVSAWRVYNLSTVQVPGTDFAFDFSTSAGGSLQIGPVAIDYESLMRLARPQPV